MTLPIGRRSLIELVGIAAAASALAPIGQAAAQTPSSADAKPMAYGIKPLPFDPKSIKGLSEKILVSHHDNNYAGAVKRLNAITEQLATLDYAKAPVFIVNGLKREDLIAANSMLLHELYFAGLGEESQPSGALADVIARDFGSVERWRAEFTAMGKAEGGGSGWILLTWNMYEHAYHMDYGAKAGDYVEAYMKAIRWANVSQLYEHYSRAT
jgi:Fe-Mn family superoxide dismutase